MESVEISTESHSDFGKFFCPVLRWNIKITTEYEK